MDTSRRDFIRKTAIGAAAFTVGGILPGFSAGSYRRIVGANDRIRVSVIGVNSRGNALAQNFAQQPQCEVATICDVDKRAIEKCINALSRIQEKTPGGEPDFRKSLEDKNVDAVVIATPDHWHTPAALLALQAGKHVYLEKPVSHNPNEGEMLIKATKKYNQVLLIGTQRRSWPRVVEAIQKVREGVIGKVHYGKGWYASDRPSIGVGKTIPVPEWLNWDLWQGPAPRSAYKDNIVHYNWHWFWRWGTAESLNNGTHMIDLLCWGMNLKYPRKVTSTGGRYYYQDDWETPDTQMINIEYENALLSWEGQSCNSKLIENSSVGVIFHGEKGNLFISGGNDYKIFDKNNRVVSDVKSDITIDPQNRISPAQKLDALHIQNFFDGILKSAKLNMTVKEGHLCTLLMQLGNISLRTGNSLNINPENGHILKNSAAQKLWKRDYERGWEPKI